jgi:hypothetical protein
MQLREKDTHQVAVWVNTRLEILRLWWMSCETPNAHDLELLIDKLQMLTYEVTQLRQELVNKHE